MSKPKPITKYHKGGTIFAKGQLLDGKPHGPWKWFRIDGTLKRSGTFDRGEPIGEWITYDKLGKVYKVTQR